MKWIVTLLLVLPSIAAANTELDFYLCSAYLQSSALEEKADGGWALSVSLSETGGTHFEQFTAANPGRMLRVIFGDQVFLRATVWAPFSGGMLRRDFSSQEIAKEWQQALEQHLPSAPCGAE